MKLENLVENISNLLKVAQTKIIQTVNHTMVLTYFEIGRMIIQEEQNGKERANYGTYLIKELSLKLTKDFGKGFSQRNLEQMRQFYLTYSIPQTASAEFKLSWSHYLKLMRVNDINERSFYEIEAFKNNWSLRELQRQFDTVLYARLAISKNKEELLQLATKGQIIETPKDIIKDPYILEFFGIS